MENKRNVNDLLIKNYSNLEFVLEPDIYQYLLKISIFLKDYNDLDVYHASLEAETFDKYNWLSHWRGYMKSLINELFNSFVSGNLFLVSAMTRSLIECYAYLVILKKEKDYKLLEDWFLCNLIMKTKNASRENKNVILMIVKAFCEDNKLDYDNVLLKFNKRMYDNKWLETIIKRKHEKDRIGFNTICDYIEEPNLKKDYLEACSFIHGQDILSKIEIFTFYESIFNRFHMMVTYIFKTIRLYPLNIVLEQKLETLEVELIELVINSDF